MRTVAGVGVAKLFIFGRLLSGRLISRLLLLWFNPQTAELPTLSQSLGVFFTDFACSSPERQACVADAVLPTLTILVAAPATSALSEIDPGLVVDLLARLTDASCLFPKVQSRVAADGGEDYKSTVSLVHLNHKYTILESSQAFRCGPTPEGQCKVSSIHYATRSNFFCSRALS